MLGIVGNIRGFVQGIVRSGVERGYSLLGLQGALEEAEVFYHTEDYLKDFNRYVEEGFSLIDARATEPGQAILGDLHVRSTWNLSTKYKYDTMYKTIDNEGAIHEVIFSVIDDDRLTLDEIFDRAEGMKPKSEPFGEQELEEPMQLVGVWSRQEAGL